MWGAKSMESDAAPPFLKWLSKKRSAIETFFSTTVQPLMPHCRISEHYYGNGIKPKNENENEGFEII
jgi:hypothetical protein